MSASGPVLWWMLPAPRVQAAIDAIQTARRPGAAVANLSAIYDHLFGAPGTPVGPVAEGVHLPVAARDLRSMPRPVLMVRDAGLTFDFFTLGLELASERLIDALDLPPGVVQWLDVDCADCPGPVRAKGYRAMNVLAFANPLDRARTAPGRFVDVDTPAGPTFAWSVEPGGPDAPPPRIAWRPDFVPPAPLFRVPGSVWTLATEDLADRVARAGIGDVTFLDVTNDGTRAGPPPPRA